MWEWELYRHIPAEHIAAVPVGVPLADPTSVPVSSSTAIRAPAHAPGPGSTKRMYRNIRSVDPLGVRTTAYNMCLTPAGLVEVLTRLATIGYKYYTSDVSYKDHLIHMLRLMNENIPGSMRSSGSTISNSGSSSVTGSSNGGCGSGDGSGNGHVGINHRILLKPFCVSFDK